jgi:hypothetical protein
MPGHTRTAHLFPACARARRSIAAGAAAQLRGRMEEPVGRAACAWVGRGGALQASYTLDAAAAQESALAALRLQARARCAASFILHASWRASKDARAAAARGTEENAN